jgi:hypothetical protein
VTRVGHTGAQGWGIALVLYAAIFAWAALSPPFRRPSEPRPPPTRVRLVETRPAEPAPPPAPKEPPPKRMEVTRRDPKAAPVAPAPLLPAPANPNPPPPAAPRRFEVSLEATVPGGGIAVPTAQPGSGPSLRATPGGTGTGPDAPAFYVEPDSAPSLIAQPSLAEMRALYPTPRDAAAWRGTSASSSRSQPAGRSPDRAWYAPPEMGSTRWPRSSSADSASGPPRRAASPSRQSFPGPTSSG